MTMRWRFADGTEVLLGGGVSGDTQLSRKLREQVALLPYGRARPVPMGPQPGSDEELVLSSPYHMDAWCRLWGYALGVALEEAPALPPMHAPHDADDEPPRGDGRLPVH